MANLSNGVDWLEIYDIFLTALPNPSKPEKHYPFQPVIVPTLLDSYIVAVSISTAIPKPTWQFGATVFPIINVVGSTIGKARVARNYSVLLNQTTIIKIEQFTNAYYQLGIIVPSWFPDIHLSVWVYKGTDLIKSADERLDFVEQDLSRIESRIDTDTLTINPPTG